MPAKSRLKQATKQIKTAAKQPRFFCLPKSLAKTRFSTKKGRPIPDRLFYVLFQAKLLSLGFLALGPTLADLESRIALANHIQTTATTHHLAIRVSKFQSANRRNNLHVPP
jgi:hypothetical protein